MRFLPRLEPNDPQRLRAKRRAGEGTRCHGVTLIELMVVLVIISILGAVALPSYKNYVIRSKIPNATSGLAQKRLLMEQFFQDNRTYVGASNAGVAICPAQSSADTSTSAYFSFYCSAGPTATSYTIMALGTGSMNGFAFSVDQANNKVTSVDNTIASGWSGGNCWISGPSGC